MKYTGRKGWQASYRDTWSLDSALSPIIHAGLVKFKEVITSDEKKHWVGIPNDYITWEPDDYSQEKWDEGFSLWLSDIDKMIYAFTSDNEPNYIGGWEEDLDHDKDSGAGFVRWNMVPTDQEGFNGSREALKQHYLLVQEGRELFAKHYNSLWW